MRIRALASLALLSLPTIVGGQITQRRPQRTPIEPASLPPAAPEVARELNYKRSRWALEAYSLFSAIQLPSAGGTGTSSVFGAGTHGDYRLTNRIAGTADVTYSTFGVSNTSYQTAEAGARYFVPVGDAKTQPFIDARATYMFLDDMYGSNDAATRGGVGPVTRYGRGLGGFAGAGLQHTLFGSYLMTTELAVMRNRMTSYRSSNLSVPTGTNYWSTTYRFSVGVRYSPQRSLALSQNPRQ